MTALATKEDLLTFKKTDEDELNSDLEKWIYSIKNMGNMTRAPRMASFAVVVIACAPSAHSPRICSLSPSTDERL